MPRGGSLTAFYLFFSVIFQDADRRRRLASFHHAFQSFELFCLKKTYMHHTQAGTEQKAESKPSHDITQCVRNSQGNEEREVPSGAELGQPKEGRPAREALQRKATANHLCFTLERLVTSGLQLHGTLTHAGD